ncbi:hypothetical protein GCM10007938_38400 [Vibrio zhanjiangensis]|uniref:Uncharacterized protein n=1 Tax=Vibrio zhanjiangensis TaxID=1046128 RepID=A0ABQ6F462_9VIBR|nr:hypothetical protein [Vibrio zhanjiangensis]GLT20057.1 hypothetical protein GCM10007938_38400 [Vibrio zhanjiangensis]
MLARTLCSLLILLSSFSSVAALNDKKQYLNNIEDSLQGIQESQQKTQDSMHYVRTMDGSQYVPEPKSRNDKPAYSYFSLESYDIYSSQGGKRMVQATITNNSGGGVSLKPSQIKAYFGNDQYVSPSRIEQDGSFAQGETKSVILYFGETSESILGLLTRSY